MSKLFIALGIVFGFVIVTESDLFAATRSSRGSSSVSYNAPSSYSGGGGGGGGHMLVDLSTHFVRDTRPTGVTDTAGRLSIGGSFSNWIGLDLLGMYAIKSRDYLVGSNIRLMPTEWFFLKGGMGLYSDKVTRELRATPIAGTGLMASMSDGYYFVAEVSYFEKSAAKNVTFGAGLGMIF